MKLKYYMRGLGIGILITTIVLSFGGKKENLSDKEIMARARELGMVMKEETDDNQLEEVLEKSLDKENTESDDVKEENDTVDIEGPSEDETVTDALEPSEGENVVDASEPSEGEPVADTSEPSEGEPVVDVSESSEEETDIDVSEPSENDITFTIARGMSSRQVSELLAEKGLIDDAVDFDNYIKRQGKAGVIKIGVYTLPEKSDYQVILSAIAG